MHVRQARARQTRFECFQTVRRHIKGIKTAGAAHGCAHRQGFAASAGAKIGHHFAALGVEQQGQQLRAFVLHLDPAFDKSVQARERRLVGHAQTPGRIRRGLSGNARFFQFFLQIGTLGVERIGTQIERCGLQHAGGQLLELIAHLRLQRLHQPFGQVVAVLRHQAVGAGGVAFVEPLHLGRAECCLDETARAGKAQNGQAALARAAARTGQRLEQGFLAQHGVGGFGQRGAFTRAQVAVLAEIARHHGVGRVFKSQDLRYQFGAGI